ncbi:hypothetical protein V5O48_013330 [Marasmius crinis-equi]|uniref:Phytocyanin domain-containing protein n=1 Tax=Marasmius crinis-equi TaxID=585013 RepID=A0ABR3F0T2_9AGAR
MVLLKSVFIALAVLSTSVSALPRPQDDSAIGKEVAVSAPNGVPITDTKELESQSSREAATKTADSQNDGGYGGYGGYTTSSADKSYETSSSMMEDSSSSMMEETTSMMEETTSMYETSSEKATETTSASYSMPTYGSGSSNWGSGYDDCVQKCIADHGAPPATYYPTQTSGSEGSSGTGSTVTVIVAPTQGVLRYVPAAVNASVGTTIKFMWGAGPHTVTKSSQLLPCNKTGDTAAPAFASGMQNKDFVFTQVVNDTNPTYYFCGVPEHCQKGMFGMINPPSSFGGATSVGGMMQGMMSNSTDLQAYASYTSNNTQGKAGANWGSSIDLKDMPEWSHSLIAENVLFTRNMLAMNPDIIKEDGSIDLSSVTSTPLMIPQDVGAQLNAASDSNGAAGSSSSPSSSSAPSSTDSAAGATQPTTTSNGASALASPKVLVAIMAVVATFFAL